MPQSPALPCLLRGWELRLRKAEALAHGTQQRRGLGLRAQPGLTERAPPCPVEGSGGEAEAAAPRAPCARPPAAHLAVHVGDAAVALGGPVELADLAHAEALGELLPDGGPQPVAHRQAHAVPPLGLAHRLLQQVAADLPDVLDHLAERRGSERWAAARGPRGVGPPAWALQEQIGLRGGR